MFHCFENIIVLTKIRFATSPLCSENIRSLRNYPHSSLTVNKWQNFPRAYPHNLIPSPTQWCSSYCVSESSFNGASDSYHNNLRRITSLYSYSHPSVLSYNSPTPAHPMPAKVFPLKDAHWRSRKRTSEDARLYISLESCCKPPTHVSCFSRTCSLSNNPDECVKMVIKYCSQDLITSTLLRTRLNSHIHQRVPWIVERVLCISDSWDFVWLTHF